MPNQLRIDPTRTLTLRKKWIRDINKRFAKIAREVHHIIVDLDVFGLKEPKPLKILVERQAWRFLSDAQKTTEFRKWLQDQVDAGILEVNKTPPWTAQYVESAYKKGMTRAYSDLVRTRGTQPLGFYQGAKHQFLLDAFNQPETLKKIELIYTRAFTDLKGVTDAMGQQMSRILASGLAAGVGPEQMARDMSNSIGKLTRTRARAIARTEVISAHAEGQLDAFEQLGEYEVEVRAEWMTAADACEECAPLEGMVMTIEEAHGLIPRHTNCRCSWAPAGVGESKKGQLWGKQKDEAIAESVKREGGKEKSSWLGKELVRRKAAKAVSKGKKVVEVPKPQVDASVLKEFPTTKVMDDAFYEGKAVEYDSLRNNYLLDRKTMTQTEVDAVNGYLSINYHEMNTYLRFGPEHIPSHHLPTAKSNIKNMRAAFEKVAPLKENQVIYNVFSHQVDFVKGQKIELKGFISSSSYPQVHFSYQTKTGYEILIPKGSKNILAGVNREELEFVFKDSSRFQMIGERTVKVKDMHAHGAERYIDMKFIQLLYLGS